MDSSTPFIQSGLASLRQPATVAVLASLGIHGLFAANVEKISLFSRAAQLPPSVELLELSPEQVGGIYPPPPPKFGLSEIAPPPSLASILGGGPTIPEFPVNAPPPPTAESFASVPQEFYTIPVYPSSGIPGTNLPPVVQRSPESYTFSTLPPSVNIPDFTPPPPSSIPEYTPPDQSNTFPDKNSEELDRAREFYEQLEQGNIEFSQAPPPLGQSGILNPPRMGDDEPGNQPPRFPPPKEPTDGVASANIDEQSQTPPEEFRGSILQGLQEGSETAENSNVVANSPVFTQEQPPEGQLSNQEMASLEGGSLYVNWVLGWLESYPDVQSAQAISISDVYPVEACEQQLSGQALVGVIIGSGGEILAGPELLLDTGYPVLDDTAIQKVQEFVSTESLARGNPTAYQYEFYFNSESCGEVSSPEQAAPQAAPENTQPAQNSSTPGVTESEDSSENSVITPPEDVIETEPSNLEPEMPAQPTEAFTETEPSNLEPEMPTQPTEAFTETEPSNLEPEMPTQPTEAFTETEPSNLEPEMPAQPTEAFTETEPSNLEPEMPAQPTEAFTETEPLNLEPEMPAQPTEAFTETEPSNLEPEITPEPTEVQPEGMPSGFEQPLEVETPAE
ncbi:energy transducer TonB [Limnoraphis robusta]|uniref:energy transducer TonB n=1 Tax=Limnoraphis robusta TaxID=1118279 RepID=UPI00066C73C2|nr:energy transducer TonB [Limnoraphis robusta]